jgi:hypothetical protein
MGTGGSRPAGNMRPGRDADHSPPSSAEVKKERGYTSSPPKLTSWLVAGLLCVSVNAASRRDRLLEKRIWTEIKGLWSIQKALAMARLAIIDV